MVVRKSSIRFLCSVSTAGLLVTILACWPHWQSYHYLLPASLSTPHRRAQLSTSSLDDPPAAPTEPSMRSLEYIHITKTGGTMVERQAGKRNIAFGACHYHAFPHCSPTLPSDWKPSPLTHNPIQDRLFAAEPWHTPPHWFQVNPIFARQQQQQDTTTDTFTIVRDPYARYISEYHCAAFGYKGEDWNTASVMNQWIIQTIYEMQHVQQHGHMLPQHYFVYNEQGDKLVTHVLKYQDDLRESFSSLMSQYGLHMYLPKPRWWQKTKTLTKQNLTEEAIAAINQYAGKDFDLFGYTMVQTATEFPEEATTG